MGKRSTKVDATEAVNEYINKEDWRINANANTNYSHASLINNLAGKVIANYWLDEVYSKEEGDAHRNGDYHIHDLDALAPYCCGHDFQKILDEGFNGVIGRVGSKPPKHFREALYQLANYFGILQAEWAGAQAVSSFDTYLAPHVFFDTKVCGLTYDDIKKAMRNFVFNLNVPSRWGQCVPETYRCLKADGTWVNFDNLLPDDEIYVIDMETGKLKKDKVLKVNVFYSPQKLHKYTNDDGFEFQVTSNHRVINKEDGEGWKLSESAEILGKKVSIPTSLWSPITPEEYTANEIDIPDLLLELFTIAQVSGNIVDDKITIYSTELKLVDRVIDLCRELNIEYTHYVDNDKGSLNIIVLLDGEKIRQIYQYLDKKNKGLYELAQKISPRQASIIIDTWVIYRGAFNGDVWRLLASSEEEQELLAGLVIKTGKKARCYNFEFSYSGLQSFQVFVYRRGDEVCHSTEVDSTYEKVWCPTTNTGTFVCMTEKGVIFFTGNSPFTNVTIDWTVPNLMKDLCPTRGGKNFFQSIIDEWSTNEEKTQDSKNIITAIKERFKDIDSETYEMLKDDDSALMLSFTYRFFQKEMNIINKAFYEVLNEGDMLGQPFTFPIPTINITEDFDWDGENVDLLFENTAKYGSSYFQNFIGSQYMIDENGNKVRDPNAYSPNDVRSMCPLALNTPVITNHGIKRLDKLDEAVDKVMLHGIWYSFRKVTNIPQQRCFVVTLDGNLHDGKPMQVVMGEHHLQPVLDQSTQTYVKKPAKYLTEADMIPVEVAYDANSDQHLQPIGNRFMYGRDRMQYIQVKSIVEIPSEPLMCIEVNNEEHNFTLGNGIITSNCRLQLDKKQLRKKGAGLFGSDAKTGSLSVVTINCPRLGYLYKGNKEKLYERLDYLLDLAKSTHEKKRKFVIDLLERGLYPYTRRYVGSFETYFSTIGVNGVNEMIRNFTNDEHNITDEFGQQFAKDLLDHIREKLVIYQEETGNLYNLEATPAEGTMRRFAHSDIKKYPDIIQAGFSDSLPYYTNSSQLPVEFTADAFTALDLQDELQKKYTGGCVEKGNYVVTDRGDILIEDIVKHFNPNDNLRVVSWNKDTGIAEWDNVVDAMAVDVSKHDKIKVSLSNDEQSFDIVTSDWHPFLVHDKDRIDVYDIVEVRADELKAGQWVVGDGDDFMVTSTSKVDVEDNQFYDLTTENNHNYLCGNHGCGVFIHNTVFHVYTRERVSSAEACKRLVKTILSNYRLPYISITPTFSVCPIHGRIEGEHEFCPKCDQEVIRKHAQEVDTNL